MAERTRYVDTASTAGGTGTADTTSGASRAYPSLSAAEAGEQTNFDTANDFLNCLCRSSVGGNDTTQLSVSGSITSPADYMRFAGNAEFYRHAVVDGATHSIPDEYVRFYQMDLSVSCTNATPRIVITPTPSSGGADIRYERCKIREVAGGGSADVVGMNNSDPDTTIKFGNCWFIDFQQGAGRALRVASGVCYAYHCVAHNCKEAYYRNGGTIVAKNCIAQDCTDGYVGVFDAASDYNISDIAADAPGANSFQATVLFVNEAGDDFHLDAADTSGAIGGGIDLSADANYPISEDFDGLAFASWSGINIGSDQFAAGGGGDQYPVAPAALNFNMRLLAL